MASKQIQRGFNYTDLRAYLDKHPAPFQPHSATSRAAAASVPSPDTDRARVLAEKGEPSCG